MGRPRKNEPRNQQLNLSLTASELEAIKRRAEAVGMRPVHFGRWVLLKAPGKDGGATPAQDNTVRLIYQQLIRLGNNLNQLVRHMHRTGEVLPADLEPLLRDIRRILSRKVSP